MPEPAAAKLSPPRGGPHLLFERRLWGRGAVHVAGVDEVGRGPLAGPVVAAAVVLPRRLRAAALHGVDDSKALPARVRAALAETIRAAASAWAVAALQPRDIDRLNIAVASQEVMRLAVATLPLPVAHVLADGLPNPRLDLPHTALVGGDGLCLSIAAASIIAKVHRDALMEAWDRVYPGYGLAQHKGYPTRAHRDALRRLGPTPLHRQSFSWG